MTLWWLGVNDGHANSRANNRLQPTLLPQRARGGSGYSNESYPPRGSTAKRREGCFSDVRGNLRKTFDRFPAPLPNKRKLKIVFGAENESVFAHKRPAELITPSCGPTAYLVQQLLLDGDHKL